MIPKTKHFEWIEDYCLGQLNENENLEFEAELGRNSELQERVNFEMDLQSAIKETDVLNLRDALDTVAKQTNENQSGKTPFELLEGFADIQDLTDSVAPEDLLNFFDSLPKVHVYQHELSSNENIHQFYKEQSHYSKEMNDDMENALDDFDLDEFEGLEEAILEKDILSLRNTLGQVSKSLQPQYSTVEIDEYLSGDMEGKELELFKEELEKNRALKQEVEMHRELESSLSELDIMNLRSEMSHIMKTETSWQVSEQTIEDFIDGVLEGELLEEFNAEFTENTDLRAELSLRKNVNDSIQEKDIFSLRAELDKAKSAADNKEIKSLIPETAIHTMRWWKAGVAVAIIVFALTGIINREVGTLDQTYDKYYVSAEWAPERAVTSDLNYLQQADLFRSKGEYEKAVEIYNEAIKVVPEKYPYRFWKATLLQDLEKYNEAIPEYSKVIKQGDNTFIEEAEWYKSLCYLKLGKRNEAKEQLLAIVERKGYYETKCKGNT